MGAVMDIAAHFQCPGEPQFLVHYISNQVGYNSEVKPTHWPSPRPFLNMLAGILTSQSVEGVILSWLAFFAAWSANQFP